MSCPLVLAKIISEGICFLSSVVNFAKGILSGKANLPDVISVFKRPTLSDNPDRVKLAVLNFSISVILFIPTSFKVSFNSGNFWANFKILKSL